MADNSVYITGVANGAFESALEGLPPWATQDTAASIEKVLKKSLKVQTDALSRLVKNATSGNSGTNTKKTQDAINDFVKAFHKANEEAEKERKAKAEEDKARKKRAIQETEIFGKKLGFDLSLAGSAKLISDTFVSNKTTFDALSAGGLNVASSMDASMDGFQSLRQLTALTGVRFTELSAAMVKYSGAINPFGVTKFSKTIGMASVDLTKFGFSSKESAELLGQYLNIQQQTLDVSKQTTEEAAMGLKKFGASVSKLSLTMGMSREQIIQQTTSLASSTEANIYAGAVGKEVAEGMTTFLGSFKDQNFAKSILDLMASPIKQLNSTFMNLTKSGLGGFAQKETAFFKSIEGMPDAVKAQAVKSFYEANKGELEQKKKQLAFLAASGNAEAKASYDHILGLEKQANATTRMSNEEIERMEKTNEASKNLSKAWEALIALPQRLFGPTEGMINFLTGVVKTLTTVLSSIIWVFDKLGAAANGVLGVFGIEKIDFTALAGLGIILAALVVSLKGIFSVVKGIDAASGAGAASGVGNTGAGKGGAGKGGMLGGLGKGLGGLGEGLGKLLSSVGKGGGALIRGIMTGIAKGIEAFGNPAVIKGALHLSGAIAILSVGLGAAAIVLGKTLPTLAEGLQGFNDIDGENLINVGKGILALSGAMVVFAATSGASAVSGMFSSLVNGISSLFGGTSMIDQLKEFASLSTGLALTASSFTIIAESLSSLSGTLASFTGIDTLKSIVTTINSIDIAKALAFGALSALNNAVSTPNASTLNSPSAVSTNKDTGGEKAIVKDTTLASGSGIETPGGNSSISTELSRQSSLLEQLLLSTNSLVSVNKDILRYSRINA